MFPRHKFKKAHEWKLDLVNKKISAKELAEKYFSEAKKNQFNSFLTFTEAKALASAAAVDKNQDPAPLAGIPMALKDIFCTEGVRTTNASKILENYIPPYSATVVDRLQKSSLLGKLNMDEFAMGSSNENSAYGPVKNPLDTEYVPGGSSGGSAAAVAGGEAVFTLGTDTGGSVRQPASFCGIVGMKPTYGRVSRYGVIAFASSLDQVGPMTLDVQDCADVLEAIAGYDEWDSTSLQRPLPKYGKSVEKIRTDKNHRQEFLRGLRVGVPEEFFGEGLDSEIRKQTDLAIQKLAAAGAKIVPVKLPHSKYSLAVYYVVAVSEASANLARYDGVRFGPRVLPSGAQTTLEEMYEATRGQLFGREVKRRILLGTFALSSGYYDAYYKKACQVRNLIAMDFAKAFQNVDVLIGPTTPTTAFKRGAKSSDPLTMYLSDIYTVPVNLAGLPALAMPFGLAGKFPASIQLVSNHFTEEKLLQTAAALEVLHDE